MIMRSGKIEDNQKIKLKTALGLIIIEGFRRLAVDSSILEKLLATHETLWNLEDDARSDKISSDKIAFIKRTIDQNNGNRHKLIRDFDLTLNYQSSGENCKNYSETPGELADRLLKLNLKIENATKIQYDATVAPEARNRCIHKGVKLRKSRSYLLRYLEGMISNLESGNAILPPRFEYKMYNDKQVNPSTRAGYKSSFVANKLNTSFKKILGIACTGHGASMALLTDSGLVRASVFDRWVRTKHTLMFAKDEAEAILHKETPIDQAINRSLTYGFGEFPPYRIFENEIVKWNEWLLRDTNVNANDIDLIVTSDGHFATSQHRLGKHLNDWFPNAQIVIDVEHHFLHQRQAFWASGFQEAVVITLDTCGETLHRLAGKKVSGTICKMNVEGNCEVLREFLFPHCSSGLLYAVITRHLGFRQGQEGKTMGLAPYGTRVLYERIRPYLILRKDGSFEFMETKKFMELLNLYVPERVVGSHDELKERHWDVAYAGQALLEEIVANIFQAALNLSGLTNIVYAGGVALNSVANEKARQKSKPSALYVCPNPGDTGHALGCAFYGAYELSSWKPPRSVFSEYLGPTYNKREIEKLVKQSGFIINEDARFQRAVEAIAKGKVVGLFQNGAEFGPRALGNRSILADPRSPTMRDFMNAKVKRREWFRPFAPSILEEYAHEWFELDSPSPFMLKVVKAKPEKKALIPAVLHVDETARVQTVNKSQNEGFWNIIDKFRQLTGVPLLLNTSFNLNGEPIVEDPESAIECFSKSNIDHLLIGEYFLSK